MSERDDRRADRRYEQQVSFVGRRRGSRVTFENSRSAWLERITEARRAARKAA